ncbi:site-specific integrase [Corynebacterium frankenforstense]|uniref:tyrosine-type recombinase/integrase n=1 Tax=Corynebacterium frankenforstense TaxID=1230998 RepID=UPI0026F0EA58|nr:site-specific integrase [Corynebacterium frankenforstense]
MASIRRYKAKSGARGYLWRVQYRSPDGRSRTKQGFATKDAAQAWADKSSSEVREGTWIAPSSARITVGELGEKWLATQTHLKASTMRVTEQTWRVHVEPQWGSWPVGRILPSDVQAWLAGIDHSASMVRKAHACLAQILDIAVGDRLITVNPARGVKLPRKTPARKVYLTAEQLGRLAGECSRRGELVWLLGTVGLRWGEAAALRVRDVNPLRGRISVERNAVTVGYRIVMGTPKTHERRSVAVPRAVMDMLVEGPMQSKAPEALLWTRPDGEALRVPAKDDWYYSALGRVMRADPEFPRVTPHGLRHVAAGLMVSAGANVKVVQRQLGHASAAMTLDTYAELFDEDLDAVAVALDPVVAEAARRA